MEIKRRRVFKVFIICIPFLFFIILELFLRLFNFYTPIPLFIDKKNGFYQVNSNIGEKYFNSKRVPVPNMYPQNFSAYKNKDLFRVFCLGGSTTAGFPYEMNVPFPQQLKFILEDQIPKKEFEVINLGLSAINSFSVLDWIPEVLKHEPDLIIIYMGHNEFYGAYGAGSSMLFTNSGFVIRLMLSMKNLHFIRMLELVVRKLDSRVSSSSNFTLMEKISNKQIIPIKSELRKIVYTNYEKNLEYILEKILKSNTPIILSNLTSNLKDQFPLGNDKKLDGELLSSSDYYQKGLNFYKDKNYDSSKVAFQLALDLDEVPFRANTIINNVLYKKAIEYDINLLDMENIFEENSVGNIPGYKLFSDHLHPNPKGYNLMAIGFYNKIIDMGIFKDENLKKMDFSLFSPLYVTNLDWEIGEQRLFKLKKKWPFSNQEINYLDYIPYDNDVTAKIANSFVFNHHIWGKSHEELALYYEQIKDFYKASVEYEVITKMFPNKIKYFYKLIECSKKASRWNMVKNTCEYLRNIEVNNYLILYDLAVAQRALGELEKSFINVNKSIQSNQLNHDQLAYALYLKALIFIDIREYDDAKKILNTIKIDYPHFVQVNKLLNKLK
tara:strand:- start:527 stop:2356 length:1830 start_codon:yes stop_codon:yes gene_type:complete